MDESLKDSRKYLVSIRDAKTEVFGPLVCVQNCSEAERMFGDLVSDKSSPIGRHPEDYSLYCLGRFDETTGSVDSGLYCVCNGMDFAKKE